MLELNKSFLVGITNRMRELGMLASAFYIEEMDAEVRELRERLSHDGHRAECPAVKDTYSADNLDDFVDNVMVGVMAVCNCGRDELIKQLEAADGE